jgi:hypothetical protein
VLYSIDHFFIDLDMRICYHIDRSIDLWQFARTLNRHLLAAWQACAKRARDHTLLPVCFFLVRTDPKRKNQPALRGLAERAGPRQSPNECADTPRPRDVVFSI